MHILIYALPTLVVGALIFAAVVSRAEELDPDDTRGYSDDDIERVDARMAELGREDVEARAAERRREQARRLEAWDVIGDGAENVFRPMRAGGGFQRR